MTVAVIDTNESQRAVAIPSIDLKVEWYSGTGAGGQHRNKHQNSCRITHIPTGLVATAQTRSRQNSYNLAVAEIQQQVQTMIQTKHMSELAVSRKTQVGSGMRGDKIRTYRFQDDRVQDHNTGKVASTKKVLQGNFDLLWLTK